MSEQQRRAVIERYLWIYAALLTFLTGLCWAVYLGQGYPELRRPLFNQDDRFGDLTRYYGKIAHLGDGASALARGLPHYNYPAPAAYIYAFLLRGFPHHPVAAYASIVLAGMIAGCILLWRAGQPTHQFSYGFAAAIVTTAVLGFPLAFTLDRGNLEGIVAVILGAGLVLFVRGRYGWAAVFIGLAASVKPFPALFFLLFARKRLYKETGLGLAVAACSIVLALTALGPNPIAAYRGLQPGVERYLNDYVMSPANRQEGRFQHSIMDGLKSVTSESAHAWQDRKSGHAAKAIPPPPVPDAATASADQGADAPLLRSHYYAQIHAMFLLCMFMGACVLGLVVIWVFRLPLINQMILIAIAITLIPPSAADYTLLHLYVPFGMFLIFLNRDVAAGEVAFDPRRALQILTLFALIFSPLTFMGRFSGDLRMALLLALLLVVARTPMQSSIGKEEKQAAFAASA